jgi:hypothetical protein
VRFDIEAVGISIALRIVTTRFDVVTVGIEDESAVVMLMILGTRTRSAVVGAAGGKSGVIKFVDLFAVVGSEGDVKFGIGFSTCDPKIRFRRHTVTDDDNATGVFFRHFHEFFVTERSEGLIVKVSALLRISDVNTSVVDHK